VSAGEREEGPEADYEKPVSLEKRVLEETMPSLVVSSRRRCDKEVLKVGGGGW
jgi:hypothetical protein